MEFVEDSSSRCEVLTCKPCNPNSTQKRKAGRSKFKETRHPIYRGVRKRNGDKWVCEVREPNNVKSRIWLGTFSNPEMAARAHDVAALALRGEFAQLNFPDSASILPQAKSSSPSDIKIAVEAFKSSTPSSPSNFPGENTQENNSKPSLDDDDNGENESRLFLDEEALFNMPILLDSMAEGLILTPPAIGTRIDWDDFDMAMDLSLWVD